ncbi:MAG: ATP-binding protein [Gemmatimonadales bacterium]|jgi:signal transduction histidine kinase
MRAASLRAKFLLIVLLGAVLPLALVGWWLTGTAVRSGRALLRGQLEAAVGGIASDARDKWTLREGELQLLANNSVVRTALAGTPARLATPDSEYLLQLFAAVHNAIPSVSYVDGTGRERWSSHEAEPAVSVDSASREARTPAARSRTFPVEIPVQSEDGRVLGTLHARVRLSGVLASDSGQHLVPGAVFAVLDARGALFSSAPDSLDLATPAAHPGWEIVTRSLESPPLRLVLAAASAPFVRPFERAAGLGLGLLMVVALVALLVSAILTGRVTGSLERMAVAAEAVAAGDLKRRVEVSGRDEVGRLAEAFNAMTESLRRTLAELSQQRALAAVGEFAASLSHEVRNSLTAIRIDLQHAVRQLPEESATTPLVTRTLETVRRLDSTVTGALRVARSGQNPMVRLDLAPLLRRAMESAQPSFVASEATLEPLALESEPVEVDGDAGALEQLFLNLLLNAAQALDAGGRARVEVRSADDRIVVRICDNGPGVESSALEEVGTVLRSTKPDGTGLGLPIAQRIAAAHGGELRIESVPGEGTTVIVTLPKQQPPLGQA